MKQLFDVSGRVVLVTGGSRGIGAMIARGYVENGARVYISSRKEEEVDSTACELAAAGECFAMAHDLSTLDGIVSLASDLAGREAKLDVLVNNAGATWGAPLMEYPEMGWDKVVDLNLKSPFFLTQKLLPLLLAAARDDGPSRVINIASVNGLTPPMIETYAYSSSKAGLVMLTRHLAKRLATDNILVNAIAPGPFATKMMAATLESFGEEIRQSIPLKRIGEPEDIAGVALFLGSRASNYVTGAVIPCDGGGAEL